MNLNTFYSLRKDFTIIGLTGRVGAGCSEFADKLSQDNYIDSINYTPNTDTVAAEELKFNICYNYLKSPGNWIPFTRINYKDVALLHLFFEAFRQINFSAFIIDVICQNGEKPKYSNRFKKDDGWDDFINWVENEKEHFFHAFRKCKKVDNLNTWLKKISNHQCCSNSLQCECANEFNSFYFEYFQGLSNQFHTWLNKINMIRRTRFNHDIANNLRKYGFVIDFSSSNESQDNIYTVSETINRIIKISRKVNSGKTKIVIDSLKNSLELMYFKEKYGAFYMIAINKDDNERTEYIENRIAQISKSNSKCISNEILKLDNTEYLSDEVNNGVFSSPDIENCIQKSDYHIYHSHKFHLSDEKFNEREKSLSFQIIRLIALIHQPGLVTPTALERTMQIAYNAKYNSGCISRQVGAVITDEEFRVKSVGWNDVAKNQIPCKLRDLRQLGEENPPSYFSEYERTGYVINSRTNKKDKFKDLIEDELKLIKQTDLNGRNMPFCFKTFQNIFEEQSNQVHTRSLHAEENAMLQISIKGGNGLGGGYLFTTASPCELCSKKAFQLGIKKIYYIDPYPGIAMTHILKNGIDEKFNPILELFRGAVGRAFHKLYEPFMSYKDELKILTDIKTKVQKKDIAALIAEDSSLTDEQKEKILEIIK